MAGQGIEIVHQFRRVVFALTDQGIRFAKRRGMNPTDLKAIVVLNDLRRDGIRATPGVLGARLGITSASTTALLDRLERLDMVSRSPDPDDRRRVVVEVTPAAHQAGNAAFGAQIDALGNLVDAYPPADRAAVARFLNDVLALTDRPLPTTMLVTNN